MSGRTVKQTQAGFVRLPGGRRQRMAPFGQSAVKPVHSKERLSL
jgi:hypothetical protein